MAEEIENVEKTTSETKKPWKSLTFWASISGLVVVMANMFGLDADLAQKAIGGAQDIALGENVNWVSSIMAIVSFILAIVGRWRASQKLSIKDSSKE